MLSWLRHDNIALVMRREEGVMEGQEEEEGAG